MSCQLQLRGYVEATYIAYIDAMYMTPKHTPVESPLSPAPHVMWGEAGLKERVLAI